MRYWYAYLPLHVCGSSGNRLLAKFEATPDDVSAKFGHCARINYANGAIEFYKRP